MDLFSDEDPFSDDNEFIALTERPRKTNAPTLQRPPLEEKQELLDTNSVEILNTKYLESIGEISILRDRLKQVEDARSTQIKNLLLRQQNMEKSSEQATKKLNEEINRLLKEKQFYIAELKNPLKRKKFPDTKTSVKHTTDQSTGLTKPSPEMKIQKVIRSFPDYKSLFLTSVSNHCLMGLERKTIDFLGSICINFDFEYNNFKVAKYASLGSAIMEYLVNINYVKKLNDLISDFLDILITLIEKLFEKQNRLPVPMLLGLIHNCLIFRSTNIINEDVIKKLFSFVIYSYVNHIQKPNDPPKMINYQNRILEVITSIFLLDIFETSCKLVADNDSICDLVWNELMPKNLIRSLLSSFSSPLNFVINITEVIRIFTLNVGLMEKQNREESDKEMIEILLSIIDPNTFGKPNIKYSSYGLNRPLGNNIVTKLLNEIIPEDDDLTSKLLASYNKKSSNLISFPFPVRTRLEEILVDPKMEYKHEIQLFYLYDSVLNVFENCLSLNSNTHVKNLKTVKSLVEMIRIQQELIIRSPRSPMVSKRVDVISKSIIILANLLLSEEEETLEENSHKPSIGNVSNGDNLAKSVSEIVILDAQSSVTETKLSLIQCIPTGVKRQMIVVLTRIAFISALSTESTSIELLKYAKEKLHYKGWMFNKKIEEDSRKIFSLDPNSVAEIPNGVEFPMDENIVGLAREILEICITPDEADNLYDAFIADDQQEM